MFAVAPDVGLQHHLFFVASQPAAIDEGSDKVSDLGYVSMRWNVIAVRQDEAGETAWKFFENNL